jgi:hypothetical protein
LSLPSSDPLFAGSSFTVSLLGSINSVLDRGDHNTLYLAKPLLHSAFSGNGIDDLSERNLFAFSREHTVDLLFIVELKGIDTFETFLEMGLHAEGLLSLSKNFEQLFGGKEVETRELGTLAVEIGIETLLHLFELGMSLAERLVESLNFDNIKSCGVLRDGLHGSAPYLIDFLELGAFLGHLLHDIVRGEDGFEGHPGGLNLKPNFETFLGVDKLIFPSDDFIELELGEGGALHSLGLDEMVIEVGLEDFDSLTIKNEGETLPVLDVEVERYPLFLHLIHGLQVAVLFGSGISNGLKSFPVSLDRVIKLVEGVHVFVLTSVSGDTDDFTDFGNVTVLNTFGTESANNRDALTEAVESSLHLSRNLGGPGQLALVEDIFETLSKREHTFVLLVDFFGVETFNGVVLPALADGSVEVTSQETEIFIRLNLFLERRNERLLAGSPLEVNLLVVDLGETRSEVCETLLDDGDIFVVRFGTFSVFVLELLNFNLDFVEFLLESLNVSEQLGLNVTSLFVELFALVFNASRDFVSLLVSALNTLGGVIDHLELVVLVEHLHPLDQVSVLVGDGLLLVVLAIEQECFELNKSLGVISLLLELLNHLSNIVVDSLGLFREDVVVDFLANLLDVLLAHGDKSLVKAGALNQEHAHAHLKGSGLANLSDGVLILGDLSSELVTGVGLLVEERFESLVFRKQEKEIVINMDALLSGSQVLLKDLSDLFFGLNNNLVLVVDIPQVALVSVGDLGVSTGNVVDFLNHLANY